MYVFCKACGVWFLALAIGTLLTDNKAFVFSHANFVALLWAVCFREK